MSGFQVGKEYKLTFEAAGIEGYSLGFGGADPFSVSVGSNVLTFGGSSWSSPSYSYGLYCSDTFVATNPTMTLRFFDGGNVPVTYATFLDDVQITQVPEPGTLVLLWRRRGSCMLAPPSPEIDAMPALLAVPCGGSQAKPARKPPASWR